MKKEQKAEQKKKQLYYIRGYYYNPKRDVYQIIHDFIEATSEDEAKELTINLFKKITDKIRIKDVMSFDLYEFIYGPES